MSLYPVLSEARLVSVPAISQAQAYPELPAVKSYVPAGYISPMVSAVQHEYTPTSFFQALFKTLPYQRALEALGQSIAYDRAIDKRAITGYVESVRSLLSPHASVASRRALFTEAIKSALSLVTVQEYKAEFESELRSQFYNNLIAEEGQRARALFAPEAREENPDTLLVPFYRELKALEALSGKPSCSPLRDLYANTFDSYAALFAPLRELHEAYHQLATHRKAVLAGTRVLEEPHKGLFLSTSSRRLLVLQNRWQQFAQAFAWLFDTPEALKPGFSQGAPIEIQEAFITPTKK